MSRTINLLRSVQAIVRQLPDLVEVTYFARTGGDTYGAGTIFRARRQPRESGQVSGTGRTEADWMLFADDGQEETVKPARLGKLVDPDGGEWHLLGPVLRSFGDLVYECRGCILAQV